ncbi:MAG: phosphoribosylglycinamide formyltransferase [Betaproteobacteria bacterium]|jgi:phosphoribosylglycinamide formyltransferase-1|nr:phosphoribosylglycinamide formyltransferase [Betaproteobacteria bacterium]NBP44815.1 phosphoribosylglycinamide formyltransferase [Betaproteobacteria bacterium]
MNDMVILISGSGSNMVALAQAAQQRHWQARFGAHIRCVISNRPDAAGLAKARDLGLHTEVLDHRSFKDHPQPREAFDAALAELVQSHQPRWVLLAGFMRVLTPVFLDRFEHSVMNIHPSLLPAFPGLNTHERALAAGCRFAGASVHWVNSELDAGHIIDQVVVPISPGDDAQSLAARVLTQEHVLYPRAVERVLSGQS